jgi:hypothetical protein
MYSYKFTVLHSSKLFEVSYICLDNYSDSCDQRICNRSASYGYKFSGHKS